MKTSKRARWKPTGNNGVPDNRITLVALSLVSESPELTEEEISKWSQDQRDEAYDWAMRIHLAASDNTHIRIPSKPGFLQMTDIVCQLPNGATLYRESNDVGGHRYWSDEIGGGVMLWDTCLVDISTLLAAIVEEQRRTLEDDKETDKIQKEAMLKNLLKDREELI